MQLMKPGNKRSPKLRQLYSDVKANIDLITQITRHSILSNILKAVLLYGLSSQLAYRKKLARFNLIGNLLVESCSKLCTML